MMRIAYLGNFDSPHNTETYIANALDRAGCDVLRLNEDQTYIEHLAEKLPGSDVFLFAKGRVGGLWEPTCIAIQEAIGRARCNGFSGQVVCWVFDLMAADFAPDRREWAENVSLFADRFFLTDGSTGLPGASVLRQGAIETTREPVVRESLACDVLYLGHPYRDRRSVFDRLVAYYGPRMRWCFEGACGDELADMIVSARVVVGPLYPSRSNYWCVDEQTEILTSDGWKTYSQVAAGDIAYTINPTTGSGEWQEITDVGIFDAIEEEMLSMEGQRHSSLTTMSHRWLIEYQTTERTNSSTLLKCPECQWSSKSPRAVAHHRSRNHGVAAATPKLRPIRKKAFKLSSDLSQNDRIPVAAACCNLPTVKTYDDAFVELVAWAWTEGTVSGGRYHGVSQSHRVNARYVARIRAALTRLCGPACDRIQDYAVPSWRESRHEDGGMTTFSINKSLCDELWDVAPNHIVNASFVAALTESQLRLFVDISVAADGCSKESTVRGRSYSCDTLAQKNGDRLDAFEMACALIGIATSRTWQGNSINIVHLKKRRYTSPLKAGSKVDVRREKYSGVVWCPTTKNGTWLARRRGTMYFTGNSNRLYVVTGCGGCFVAPEISGMREEGWIPGAHYLEYDGTAGGAIEVIDEALLQDDLRGRVAAAGKALCFGSFTYDHRVAEFLERLK